MKSLIVIAGVLGALIGAGAALERQPARESATPTSVRPRDHQWSERIVGFYTVQAQDDDVYNDGLIACKFIADEFGEAALLRVLASNESTFGQRLHSAVGIETDEFTRRLRAWTERTMEP